VDSGHAQHFHGTFSSHARHARCSSAVLLKPPSRLLLPSTGLAQHGVRNSQRGNLATLLTLLNCLASVSLNSVMGALQI